jgi:hypothetical protein
MRSKDFEDSLGIQSTDYLFFQLTTIDLVDFRLLPHDCVGFGGNEWKESKDSEYFLHIQSTEEESSSHQR